MKKDSMQEWVLRDELLSAFHNWPVIVAFILVGIIFGVVIAFLWPSSYRAWTELSVGLNPYRALDDRYVSEFANVEFRNVDDYKHWQMSQLAVIVLSDQAINETRARLIQIDPYWESVQVADLRDLLQASWRNAGRWLLSAEGDSPERAIQALETWQNVILEITGEAIAVSRGLFELELKLRTLNDQLIKAQACLTVIEQSRQTLDELSTTIQARNPNEPFPKKDRFQLFNLVVGVENCIPGWNIILDQIPAEGSPTAEYINWIEEVATALEGARASQNLQIEQLEAEISEGNSEWESTLLAAQGLSASLSVEKPTTAILDVKRTRSLSSAALVGGLSGLLAWFLVFLVRTTRADYK